MFPENCFSEKGTSLGCCNGFVKQGRNKFVAEYLMLKTSFCVVLENNVETQQFFVLSAAAAAAAVTVATADEMRKPFEIPNVLKFM